MSLKNNQDPNKNTRIALSILGFVILVVGICLLIPGISSFAYGALNFFSLPIGDNSILIGMFLMAGGGFSIIISLNILRYAYRRRFVSYAVEETGQGLGQVSDRALDGIGRVIGKGSEAVADGINKAGGLRLNAGQDIKEIVVVKCRNCGEKNDEDANFCDNCGQPL